MSIVSDRDSRFLRHFWRSLWKQLGTSLDISSAYLPQSDGQTDVINRSLGNLLRFLVGDAIRTWDSKLPQPEFAHNHSLNRSLGYCPFQVVYGIISRGPVELSTLPDRTRLHDDATTFVDSLSDIHSKEVSNLESSSSKYKQSTDTHRRRLVFEVRDFVWAYLTRDRMSAHDYNKLKARKIGPLKFWSGSMTMPIVFAFQLISIHHMSLTLNTFLVLFQTTPLQIRGRILLTRGILMQQHP